MHPNPVSAAAEERFIYADKIGAGPEHPAKQWGLFTTELTVDQARQRYERPADRTAEWFGIVRLGPGEERPSAYLQMSPQANGVVLQKLNAYGTVMASYTWRGHQTADSDERAGQVFLSQIYFYAYPDEQRFLNRISSLGNVEMTFSPDGRTTESRVTKRGFDEPSDVETRAFDGVDVTVNWTPVPEFGDWAAFFTSAEQTPTSAH